MGCLKFIVQRVYVMKRKKFLGMGFYEKRKTKKSAKRQRLDSLYRFLEKERGREKGKQIYKYNN